MQRKDITQEMVLLACEEFTRENQTGPFTPKPNCIERLRARTGAPEKVLYAAMWREEDRGTIDYGVSVRCAWPTEKGESILAAIRAAQ